MISFVFDVASLLSIELLVGYLIVFAARAMKAPKEIAMNDHITQLRHLPDIRVAAGITRRQVESITMARRQRYPTANIITVDRLKQLETAPRHEPYYDEARDLARILLLDNITPLVSPGQLGDCTPLFGDLQARDYSDLAAGYRLPLSTACRIALDLGLDDPIELERHPRMVEIWSVVARNERGAAPGSCPWCLGVNGLHRPTCIPDVILAPRATRPYDTSLAPVPAKPRSRGDAHLAHGLRTIRIGRNITQGKVATDCGLHPNYYSRIERCEDKLTRANAEKIAALIGCTVDAIYAA